jgi:hypothetical protein
MHKPDLSMTPLSGRLGDARKLRRPGELRVAVMHSSGFGELRVAVMHSSGFGELRVAVMHSSGFGELRVAVMHSSGFVLI